jgi:p70 ribosomal S6 kinase
MRSGHGKAVDWWSLGALMYDMLTGAVSFTKRFLSPHLVFNPLFSLPSLLRIERKPLTKYVFISHTILQGCKFHSIYSRRFSKQS